MSMHGNEMNNVKACYEILYNIGMDDKVVENNQYIKLDNYLINIVDNTDQLFLAVEQGSGRYENSVIVINNPRRILKVK